MEAFKSQDETKEKRAGIEEASDGNGNHSTVAGLGNIPIDDSVGLYLTEMGQVPLLTHEEEVALAKQLERGQEARRQLENNGHNPAERARLKRLTRQGQEARDHLIEANTRLVVSVAKKYRGLGMPFLDLIQAGNLGLIRAVDRFDYRRGYRLATYATWWIRQGVTRALSQQGRTIRIPVHMSDRIRRLLRVAQRIEQDLGRRPTPEEIAAEIEGLDPEEAHWMLRVSQRPISLERPMGDEEGADELGDFIEDESAPSPTQTAERHLLRERLRGMLTSLTPREVHVLRLRFGLNGGRVYTLKEIGNKLGVTRERARQIQSRALRKLRHPRHSRALRDYLGH
jgi:RNA polymerase primary sigma factor